MDLCNDLVDILGVGFGPANVALAAALEELAPKLRVRFIEGRNGPHWQPNMLLPGSDIQNHPLRDLVTPRNPRSRYSFTNYLFENRRLYEHLNLPLHYPLRVEYAQYVSWVASFFVDSVDYGSAAKRVTLVDEDSNFPRHYLVATGNGKRYRAKSLILAPGRTPYVPAPFSQLDDPRVQHLNNYMPALATAIDSASSRCRVAVIGGSQSAVEILLHASQYPGVKQVIGYTRNFSYRQKDTSPFSDEVYFPSFVDAYYQTNSDIKQRLRNELVTTNYSSADIDVLSQLYLRRYEQSLLGLDGLRLERCQEIIECSPREDGVLLVTKSFLNGQLQENTFDLVILATGFMDLGDGERQERCPALLTDIVDTASPLAITRDYRIEAKGGLPTYLNGLCESSHGMGDAGSFSLLAIRSGTIVESLLGRLAPRV
ncbi:SidA/IucD/PvdA family monooxygenase [Pseudomonas sp. TWI672]|uniref:SidA/IucD/PvdA family monooxygenase n=1 Tax=unclassified Pseudomonas TaxID=196821 RepID=UPI0032082060